jgi:hypothetical protein
MLAVPDLCDRLTPSFAVLKPRDCSASIPGHSRQAATIAAINGERRVARMLAEEDG